MRNGYVRAVVALIGLINAAAGAWAFFAPRSFYDSIATFPPYNLHLLHDVGAFQLGLGAAVLGALVWRDAVFVALFGGTVGTGFHFVSHLLDRDLGGRAIDAWGLGGLSLLLVAGLVLRFPERR